MFSLHPFTFHFYPSEKAKASSQKIYSSKSFLWWVFFVCSTCHTAEWRRRRSRKSLNRNIYFFNNKMLLFLCCYHYNFVKNRWKIWQVPPFFFCLLKNQHGFIDRKKISPLSPNMKMIRFDTSHLLFSFFGVCFRHQFIDKKMYIRC